MVGNRWNQNKYVSCRYKDIDVDIKRAISILSAKEKKIKPGRGIRCLGQRWWWWYGDE